MPARVIQIGISTTLDARGAKETEQWLTKLAQAQQKAVPSGGADKAAQQGALAQQKLATETQKTATAANQASAAQQRQATETQKTALASNQAAVAAQRLATEEQRTAAAALAAAAAQSRAEVSAIRLAKAQDQAANSAQRSASFAKQMGDAFTGSLMSVIGPAAAAGLAIQSVGATIDLIKVGAQAEQTALRFDALAKTAGTTGDALMEAMRSASAGTISDLNLQLAANKAQLLGVADSAGEFSVLMEIARDRAQQMGISTEFAFDSIVTGLGRGSALILDNIGITVEVAEVNEAYAVSLGKTVAQLSEAEKKQALINAVVEQGRASLDAAGGAAETNATKIERFGASIDNAKASVGGLFALQAGPFLDEVTKVADALSGIGTVTGGIEGATKALAQLYDLGQTGPVGQLQDLGESLGLPDLSTQIGSTTASWGAFISALQGGASVTEALNAAGQATQAALSGVSTAAPVAASGVDLFTSASMTATGAAETARAAYDMYAAAITQLIPPTNEEAAATLLAANAHRQGEYEARAFSVATNEATMATLADAAAKTEQAAQTELATLQANAAADAFMALHPEITASGVASLSTAGEIDPLLAQLVMARIRASEASAELARFRALAGMQATAVSDYRAGERSGGKVRTLAEERAQADRMSEIQRNQARTAQEQLQADLAIARAKGDQNTQVELLRQSQQGLIKGSTEYKQIEASIISLQNTKGAGGSRAAGGGGGADKAAKAAEATTGKLADIAKSSGDKLSDIQESTQAKLLAIDEKYAAQRLQAIQSLNDDIASANAGTAFDQQMNDFEQFGKDMSDEQKAAFEEREKAEARYNERVRAIQESAKQEAVSGDADLAKARLAALEADAKRQMEIEQKAAQANIDTGGDQADAVAAQAAEASAASKAQADTEVAIAEAKAAEKTGAMQAEKDAVIASANEQAEKVISAATEQAAKVKGASDSQKSTVISNLNAQADAARDWASAISSASRTAQSAMDGVTGPETTTGGESGEPAPAATGGGQGLAGGGRKLGKKTAGSGASAPAGDILETLRQAVSYLSTILPMIKHQNELLKHVRTYQHTMMNTIKVFGEITALHKALAQPLPPLPANIFEDLAGEVNSMMKVLATKIDPQLAKSKRLFEHILGANQAAVAVFTEILALRQQLAVPTQPVMLDRVQELADESVQIVAILRGQIITANQRQTEDLERFASLVGDSVGILSDVADLRTRLSEDIGHPIDLNVIVGLAQRAAEISAIVQRELIPTAEATANGMQFYADAVMASVSVLTAVVDLRSRLSEDTGSPFSMAMISGLAVQSADIARVVAGQLIPTTEATADGMSQWADLVGSAVQILTDVVELRGALADATSPISMALIQQIAGEATQIAKLVYAVLIPTTEETAAGFSRYADTVGSAVDIISGVTELRRDVKDLASPLPLFRIRDLVIEASRIASLVRAGLVPTTEEQATALGSYADAVGSAVSIVADVAALRADMQDMSGPISINAITALVIEASRITALVRRGLIPTTEEQAAGLGQYADSVGAAVSIVSDVAGLRKDMVDLAPPIPLIAIERLAGEAMMIRRAVAARLVPTSEDVAAGFSQYADSVGASVAIISDVAGLRKDAADLAPPLSEAQIIRLADDAKRITRIVLARLLPTSEEQAAAAQRYADTTGSAVSALSATLGLSAKMFTDYVSPSDAQINRVVADANRIVKGVDKAARLYSTEGLEAAQAFGDATGSIIGAFKDQLLFAQALGSGDFKIDLKNLALFETGLSQTLAVANRLGAQAAAIPAGNITALQSATTALTSAYDSMIKLGAVPFGNLTQLTAGLNQGLGGGTNITVNINNPAAGLNVAALKQQVIQGVTQALASRH